MNNRLLKLFIIFSLASPVLAAWPEIPSEDDAIQLWKAKRISEIELAKESEPEDRTRKLGKFLWGLSELNYRKCDEKEEILKRVIDAIKVVPGHGSYLLSAAESERQRWKEGRNHRYDYARIEMFQTLQALPTIESVKVLGELLSDDSGVPYPHGEDPGTSSPPENPIYAQEALTILLDDPPADGSQSVPLHIREDDLKTWQLWFEQVKAGTRTFRFKGDPQPYTLEGPAERELRPGADDADQENHRRRTEQNQEIAQSDAPAGDDTRGAKNWWLVGGALGLVTAILLGWRKLQRTIAKP